MLKVVLVKSVGVSQSVGKFNINRREARFHKFKIDDQASCSAVAVDKRMYALKLNMEACKLRNNMLIAFGVILKQFVKLRLNKISVKTIELTLTRLLEG